MFRETKKETFFKIDNSSTKLTKIVERHEKVSVKMGHFLQICVGREQSVNYNISIINVVAVEKNHFSVLKVL